MQNFRLLSIFIVYLFIAPIFSELHAQKVEVKNVAFEQQGNNIIIRYNLLGNVDKKYTISVFLSNDYGVTFPIKPESLSGDAGKNIIPGYNKEIVWYLREDYPRGLDGEGFVFAVDAKLQKGGSKWPWYILGAGVAGGAAYFVTQSLGGKEDKGSISISISDEL